MISPFRYVIAMCVRKWVEQLEIEPFTFRDITPPLVMGGAS
jgi:hypothetical protein